MARFSRLRWVPMLLKAYYNAQSQIEQSKVQSGGSEGNTGLTDSTGLSKQPIGASGDTQSLAPTTRNKNAARRRKPRQPQGLIKPRINTGTNTNRRRRSQDNYRSTAQLLRELRMTNQKLEELQSIRQQLQDLGMTMEEFEKKLSQLQTLKEGQKNSTGAPGQGGHVMGQPVMQPGYPTLKAP